MGDTPRKHDEDIHKLSGLIRQVSAAAVDASDEIKGVMEALARSGVSVKFEVFAKIQYTEPDYDVLDKEAKRRRICPYCSTKNATISMRGTLINDRVKSDTDHEVIEGLQTRWRCPICGLGVVESHAVNEKPAAGQSQDKAEVA